MTKRHSLFSLRIPLLLQLASSFVAVGVPALSTQAEAALSRERNLFEISKHLKPIPDQVWQEIAGGKSTEKYEITQGDTLYSISQRLFGDAKYWPKIWALNNDSITNPHRLRPGVLIAFMPGTGTSLPSVSLSDSPSIVATSSSPSQAEAKLLENASHPSASKSETRPLIRSAEWKNLPKQGWEGLDIVLTQAEPVRVDDRIEKAQGRAFTFELDAFAASEEIAPLAHISTSSSSGIYLRPGDKVFIKADDEETKVQIGESYAVTADPHPLTSPTSSSRKGFSYPLIGEVKIIGRRDDMFIGTVVGTRHFLGRNAFLIPAPARIPTLPPEPGPEPLEASVLLDPYTNTKITAQHRQAFVDLGSEDGLKPGMAFFVFQHKDPVSGLKTTDSDIVRLAVLQVIQVSERFSTVLVTKSRQALEDGASAVLVTDPKQFEKDWDSNDLLGKDELDALDQEDRLDKDDEDELKQLENWKGNQTPPATPAASSTEDESKAAADLFSDPDTASGPSAEPMEKAPTDTTDPFADLDPSADTAPKADSGETPSANSTEPEPTPEDFPSAPLEPGESAPHSEPSAIPTLESKPAPSSDGENDESFLDEPSPSSAPAPGGKAEDDLDF